MPTTALDATTVALAHLAAVAVYLGFQLTVRFVVYPQMAAVGAAAFPAYEASHQRRVSLLVGPLFLAVGATALLLLVTAGVGRPAAVACCLLSGAVLVVTAAGAVPQHRTLSDGFDAAAHRRLLAWDGVRVALSTTHLVVAAWLALEVVSGAGALSGR